MAVQPSKPESNQEQTPERPETLVERLKALSAKIRAREADFANTTVWACQSDARWHADEFGEWADELDAVLSSLASLAVPSTGEDEQEDSSLGNTASGDSQRPPSTPSTAGCSKQHATAASSGAAPQEPRQRSIAELRGVVSMLCHFIWHRKTRPGDHLWSIPVDPERDFDCILTDAIDELEKLRAVSSGAEPQEWQPIETLDDPDREVLMWTPRERIYTPDQLKALPDLPAGEQRVSTRRHWTWATKWQPLPAPPERPTPAAEGQE